MRVDDITANALRWYVELKEQTNDTFFPLYFNESRFLVLMGGGGSGKSVFAARKVLERATSESGHRILICRKVARTLRESCFRILKEMAYEHYRESISGHSESDMRITFNNGSELIFAGLDDVEKLKSIYHITSIWIEEASELLETDLNQLDIRLRDETPFYKQIILTFNPISITHWLKSRFFDRTFDDVTTHRSTYRDNRFISADAIKTLERFKETDEYYYQVYCLGMWGVTGKSVFNAKELTERLQHLPTPKKRGTFAYAYDGLKISDVRFVDETDGGVTIFEEPKGGYPYVIGADTAGEGSDYFVAQVLDNTTGRQVAILRQRFDEDIFARQLYCLAELYNNALVGIETNLSTYPVMELERLGYQHQYVRETVDDYTHGIKRSFGFRTDSRTRPIIIAGLVQASRDDKELVSDEDTISEMLTFIRNEDFRAEAEQGAHDDCVMALAIAQYIRGQQRYTIEVDNTVRWTPSMWEDYNNASPSEKEYLIRKWGVPKK